MSDLNEVTNIEERSYESADFWRVGSSIRALIPAKLHHPDVCNSQNAGARQFSTERKHSVHLVDLPTKTLSMTVGGILPGQRTSRHRHNYETIIYVIKGQGRTYIEERNVEWQEGDAFYIPVWAWHYHENCSETVSCLYVACENAPLLQNLGRIAVREEEVTDHPPTTTVTTLII